jgi:hypothetical protein
MRTAIKVKLLSVLSLILLGAIPIAYYLFGIQTLVPLLLAAMLSLWFAQDLRGRSHYRTLKTLRDTMEDASSSKRNDD